MLVAHQVEVTLAVLGFAVGDTVPLVRHGTQRFTEHGELVDFDGRLTLSCGEALSLNTNPITKVEQLVKIPVGLADTLFVEVNLDAALDVTDGGEDGLTHVADGEQSARDGDGLLVCEVSLEFARGGSGVEFCSVGVNSEFTDLAELFTPDGDEFCFGGLGSGIGRGRGWLVAHEARRIGANRNNSRAEMRG